MSRLDVVLTAMATTISAAINNAGITTPNQVGVGKPNYEDLTKIIIAGEAQVTIYPEKGGKPNVTRFYPRWMVQTPLNVTLTASVSGNTVTFSGVPQAGLNVHALVGMPLQDSYFLTAAGDTLATIASKAAAAVNALALAGVTATASGNGFTVAGSPNLICNVGGTATLAQQVASIRRLVKVSVWTPDPDICEAMEDAIITQVGNAAYPRYPLPDGTQVVCKYHDNVWSDERVMDYSMYVAYLFFTIEYGQLVTTTATQIGAFKQTTAVQGTTLPPIFEG